MTALVLPVARPRVADRRWIEAIAVAGTWALATALLWDLPLDNDLAWQYWVARQLRGGAALYRDIAETNPPLWFWSAVPLSALADRLGLSPDHLAIAAVNARAVAALWLVWRLSGRAAMVAGMALALAVLTLFGFGEREQLMAIGALPYACLAAARAERRPVASWLALATGLLAAAGFALKPYFALTPLALEAWLAATLRRDWRADRPETRALAAVALAYAAAVLLVTPAYLGRRTFVLLAAYDVLRPAFAQLWWEQYFLPAWALAATALALHWRRADAETRATTVTALAGVAIYAVQRKGFPYHGVPATVAFAAAAWLAIAREPRAGVRALAWGSLLAAGVTAWLIGVYRPSTLGRLTDALDRLPRGSTVAIVSAHGWEAFPLVERRGFVWPLRGLSVWPFAAIARGDARLAASTRAALTHDLWCHPPDAILFDDPARSPAMPRGFSYRGFVAADPAAARLLAGYRTVDRRGGASLLLRTRPIAPRGPGCRAISVAPYAFAATLSGRSLPNTR